MKCKTESNKEGYENVPVELSDHEFLTIARMAHERDITFNKMVEAILWNYINETKSKIPTLTDEVPKHE
jgi:hypothetical protein